MIGKACLLCRADRLPTSFYCERCESERPRHMTDFNLDDYVQEVRAQALGQAKDQAILNTDSDSRNDV